MLIQILQVDIAQFATITNQINTVINSLQKGVISDVTSFARAIGLFGAILTLLVYYQKCQINGDPIVFKELYPLVIIVIALSAFPFIASTIDTSAGFLQSAVESSINTVQKNDRANAKIEELRKNDKEINSKDESTASMIEGFTKDITAGIQKTINAAIMSFFLSFITLLMYIVTFVFNILFTIKKMILYVFGPFSIGLSTIPIYRKSGLNWLNSYFTLAIAQVLSTIFLILYNAVTDSFISTMPSQLGLDGILIMTLVLFIFGLLMMSLIFKSEQLAGKLMALDTTSSAAGVAGGVVKGASQMASKMITKI